MSRLGVVRRQDDGDESLSVDPEFGHFSRLKQNLTSIETWIYPTILLVTDYHF